MSAGPQSSDAAAPPRVSVIIPTYNRARDIARCLESVAAQTFRDVEVLVCDDGSRDGTDEIVRGFEGRLRVQYLWSENFGGPARPRNIGIRNARGEYLAFLDADDWWHPEKLAVSVGHLDAGADLVYHDLHLATRAGQRWFPRKSATRVLRAPVFADLLGNGNAINNSSVVVKRRILQQAGGFSEESNLISAEDFDAWVQVARVTDAFVRIPRALGYYWVGGGNISNPQRTVSTLQALEARYAKDLASLSRSRCVYWISYTKARAHFVAENFRAAQADIAAFDWSGAPVSIRLRVKWMRAICALRAPARQGSCA